MKKQKISLSLLPDWYWARRSWTASTCSSCRRPSSGRPGRCPSCSWAHSCRSTRRRCPIARKWPAGWSRWSRPSGTRACPCTSGRWSRRRQWWRGSRAWTARRSPQRTGCPRTCRRRCKSASRPHPQTDRPAPSTQTGSRWRPSCWSRPRTPRTPSPQSWWSRQRRRWQRSEEGMIDLMKQKIPPPPRKSKNEFTYELQDPHDAPRLLERVQLKVHHGRWSRIR